MTLVLVGSGARTVEESARYWSRHIRTASVHSARRKKMTAKEYLSRVIKLKRKAESLSRKEEDLRTKAEGLKAIVYDRDKVQVSAADRMPEVIADMVAVQEEIGETIAECYRYIRKCEDQIGALKSAKQIEVLRWRYIEDNNGRQYYFSEIADMMNIDITTAFRLHKRAIANFAKKYKMSI